MVFGLGAGWVVGAPKASGQGGPAYLSSASQDDARCPADGFVALLPAASALEDCPAAPSGWNGEPLFAGSADRPSVRDAMRRAGLPRFCLYRPDTGGGGFPSGAPPFGLEGQVERLDRDCAALELAGDDLWATAWPRAEEHFLAQAGQLPLAAAGVPVRLVVVDTQPTGAQVPTVPGVSAHGFSLAHMAHRLVCGELSAAACAVQVETYLALPILRFEATESGWVPIYGEPGQGGRYGRLSDLAQAIFELAAGADGNALGPRQRLVLNLSLGWRGELFGGGEGELEAMPAGVQAVRRALAFARDRGVLVVAAAGNRVGDGGVADCGAVYPAAWEAEAPKDLKPLVFAAGGVGSDGRLLANARRCGLPKRFAYADHAVVTIATESGLAAPTAALTGSSVASLVVATAAAATWARFPHLAPNEVMSWVDQGGDRLPPDLVPEPGGRRVSACSGLAALCRPSTGAGLVSACRDVACPPWDPRPLALTAPSEGFATDLWRQAVALPEEPSRFSCATAACGLEERAKASQWPVLRPQPEEDPCLNCALTSGGPRPPSVGQSPEDGACRLIVKLRPAWFEAAAPGSCLYAPQLVVERFGADEVLRRVFASPEATLCASEAADSLTLELDRPCVDFAAATLRARFALTPEARGPWVEGQVLASP